MDKRFTDDQLDAWRRDGAVLLDRFLTPDEIAPVRADFETLYGGRRPQRGAEAAGADGGGQFNPQQFTHIDNLPFDCSPALNLLGLHPALIELARAALGTRDVRLYQSHTWAKHSGETDYEQPFHCDYKNHTLTVPSDDTRLRTINFMIYVTDVTIETGAIAYVPQPDSDEITGPNRAMFFDGDAEAQAAMRAVQRRGVGPAGSVFAYGIDVYHRGMNLTAPDGVRYTLTASYKAAGNDMIGWSAWPYWFLKPWRLIFDHATPDQLSCLGVPPPGDPFWTPRTLERTRERWPGMDFGPYEAALERAAAAE